VVDKGEIIRRDLVTGKVARVLGLPGDYSAFRSSPNGTYLAAHTGNFWDKDERNLEANILRVVDTSTGKQVFALDGKKGEQFVCEFAQGGQVLAVNTFRYELDQSGPRGDLDLKESYLTLWEVGSGRKLWRTNLLPKKWAGNGRWPSRDRLSPSGHLALTRGDNGVELRELATNARIAELAAGSSEPEGWGFSRDGKFVAVGIEKGQILLWSVYPPKLLATLPGHNAAVTSVHFSPDGQRLVSGSDDTTILVWDLHPWTVPAAKSVEKNKDTG
jgi:WD40 repeat protein